MSSAGCPPISTVGAPGTHGAVVTGIQGIGVSTPIAAEVAAATVGFPRHEHIPKGIILTIGLLSMIFARGIEVSVLFIGKTLKVEGAAPNEQASIAPPHTAIAILCYFLSVFT